jgi:hypothetical protein
MAKTQADKRARLIETAMTLAYQHGFRDTSLADIAEAAHVPLGINVVLVARREALLAELGCAISQECGVQYRALAVDLSQEGFIAGLADATHDLDIGLVVSNAGTPNPGEFLKLDRQLLQATLRLNTMAHLDIPIISARNSPSDAGAAYPRASRAAGKPVQDRSGPTESLRGRICASFRETDDDGEGVG